MKYIYLNIIILIVLGFGFLSKSILSIESKLKIKAHQAKTYCKVKGMNTEFCILIDMSVHSGKNRLYVYNFRGDSTINKALCAHGSCDNLPEIDQSDSKPKFSNVHETHCSSLGKYKIGKRGYSNWGVHFNYKLHGLESTNNNAYARTIVLHSWEMMPDNEVYPKTIPYSWGCPMVSDKEMKRLDILIKTSKKPVLLWIYE